MLDLLNLKKLKSAKKQPQNSNLVPLSQEAGWETAFNPSKKTNGLVHTNGMNGDGINLERLSDSPEAVDFEAYIQESEQQNEQKHKKQLKKNEGKSSRKMLKKQQELDIWKFSEPIGGRMINVDPLFTFDEKYAFQ